MTISKVEYFTVVSYPGLLPGGGERADLVVGAVAAGLARGGGLEAAGADAGGGRLDGGDRLLQIVLGRDVAADDARLDETQLNALGQAPGHLAPGQRVHLELEVLRHAAVGVLLADDLAGLVIHDDDAQQVLVHAVEAPAHAVVADREREVLLDPRRLEPRGFFLVPEARERLAAGGLARLLVLPGEEALVEPLALVLGQQVVQRGVVALHAALEIELHDRVDRAAVDDRVMAEDRHAELVDVT